jgi:hypothetical protein
MESHKKAVIIPPYWKTILDAICLFSLGLLGLAEFYICGHDRLKHANWFLGVGTILFLKQSFHAAITPKGLQIRFLYIPVCRISWERISTAQYIHTWKATDKGSERNGCGIFITRASCPLFVPEVDGLNMFQLKHPFTSFFIQFTEKNKKKYVNAFRHYYPELSFQLGCDEKEFED